MLFHDPSDQPSQHCVLRQMATDSKRATNLAFSIPEKFVTFFNVDKKQNLGTNQYHLILH